MRRNKFVVFLILCIWFVISFITNILGPIMPVLIDNYQLSLTLAAFLPFSFFLAYGIMSIPAGMMIERFGEKPSMLVAFGFTFIGSFLFALFPVYGIALASLFILGIGMAMLQVIINPLMREAGGEEHFAFNSVLAQLIFGAASFLSPFVFTYLMHELKDYNGDGNWFIHTLSLLIPKELPWSSLYWIFSVILISIFLVIIFVQFPKVELKEDEKAGAVQSYLELFKKKQVILYFLGIMAYVGTEQGLSNWMSKFLNTYHGYNPEVEGASAIAWFWGLMSVGCLLGLLILKLADSKLVLKVFSLLAMATVGLALFGPAAISLWAFPTAGFFLSVMFSIIFSLALNSEEKHHGSFSGILCSGIFGGALVPLIIGWIGDQIGLRSAMLFLFITLSYILAIPFWAKPLVDNKTVKIVELFKNVGPK
ncbi:MAG TPA: MFS transporter [Prolixibacteraceae bacterium]|nr:MFS transporter [Prolixibacteraceae bacterium]